MPCPPSVGMTILMIRSCTGLMPYSLVWFKKKMSAKSFEPSSTTTKLIRSRSSCTWPQLSTVVISLSESIVGLSNRPNCRRVATSSNRFSSSMRMRTIKLQCCRTKRENRKQRRTMFKFHHLRTGKLQRIWCRAIRTATRWRSRALTRGMIALTLGRETPPLSLKR